ncbi:UNVERIFIED_CONTAM: hypothetical protein PYX00_011560 [Menopon gallinae]|uniref:Uncharacterized protein n=1 Tax=Menopon gallinae TaxID=328185 RepID=A0AAW2H851_9NEOP
MVMSYSEYPDAVEENKVYFYRSRRTLKIIPCRMASCAGGRYIVCTDGAGALEVERSEILSFDPCSRLFRHLMRLSAYRESKEIRQVLREQGLDPAKFMRYKPDKASREDANIAEGVFVSEMQRFVCKKDEGYREEVQRLLGVPLPGTLGLRLYTLYKVVCANGGMDHVIHLQIWKRLFFRYMEKTNTSYVMRTFYKKYLYEFELERRCSEETSLDFNYVYGRGEHVTFVGKSGQVFCGEVVARRNRGLNVYYVKFLGWSEENNEWISEDILQRCGNSAEACSTRCLAPSKSSKANKFVDDPVTWEKHRHGSNFSVRLDNSSADTNSSSTHARVDDQSREEAESCGEASARLTRGGVSRGVRWTSSKRVYGVQWGSGCAGALSVSDEAGAIGTLADVCEGMDTERSVPSRIREIYESESLVDRLTGTPKQTNMDGLNTLEDTVPCQDGTCSLKCMLYIVSSLCLPENRCAGRDIRVFLHDFGRKGMSTAQMQHMYRVFLRHMRARRHVRCRVGMFYLEKYILFSRCRTLMFDRQAATRNQFINNKVVLYQWIRPEFLDAKVSSTYVRDAAVFCEMINSVHTPTEKLYCIVEISRLVYEHGGSTMGQDDFLPVFIFTFVHLRTRDLLLNLLYIQRYMPMPAAQCHAECTHVGTAHSGLLESCECTIRVPCCGTKEALFYLTNFEAAVVFIERLEYRDLRVDRSTYNRHIEKYSCKIDTTCLDTRKDGLVTRIARDIAKRVSALLGLGSASRHWFILAARPGKATASGQRLHGHSGPLAAAAQKVVHGPSMDKTPGPQKSSRRRRQLYITNIDVRVSRQVLYELLVQTSPILHLHYPYDTISRQHRSYCIAEYPTEEDADYAYRVLNMVRLYKRPLRFFRMHDGDEIKLYVHNLDASVDEKMLYDVLEKCGRCHVRIAYDEDGRSKKYAFAVFYRHEDAERAIRLSKRAELCGRKIEIEHALRKRPA